MRKGCHIKSTVFPELSITFLEGPLFFARLEKYALVAFS